METTGVKIQFSRNHRSMIARPALDLVHSGHLVFNIPSRLQTSSSESYINKTAITDEVINDAYPFFSLNIKNQAELFKVGSSFINDIEQGRKQFGFASLFKEGSEKHLLAYGSFVNYTLKGPVLIVVKDLDDKSWDQYRANFKNGTLWKWNCSDWGDLCFVDYKQITRHADSFNRSDFSEIADRFSSVMWSLPDGELHDFVPQNAISILGKINSVTFVVSEGDTSSKKLKKMLAYYKCFGIPVKGVLTEGKTK